MGIDPIVEEIHKIREKLSQQFNFDIDKIYEDIKKKEVKNKERVVNLKEKVVAKA